MPPDELHKIALDKEKAIRDQIDNYRDTIFAILGFCSLWFFDSKTRQYKSTVSIFQGRRLSPVGAQASPQDQEACIADVCPDLGIVVEEESGILGEVKKNFPKDSAERKRIIFSQLKSYDQEFTGWPTKDGKLKHNSTSNNVSLRL